MKTILKYDEKAIRFFWKYSDEFGRVALAIIFVWFGILKVLAVSPANGLVTLLLLKTMPFIPVDSFIIVFGVIEMCIGILFLIPRMGRIAILLLLVHMFTTMLPLLLLPEVAWQYPYIPTLEGQYILKNLALIALALGIAAHLHPLKESIRHK